MEKDILQKMLDLRKAIAGKFLEVDNLYIRNYKKDTDEPVSFTEDKMYRVILLYAEGATPETYSDITDFGFDILAFVVDDDNKFVVVNLQKSEVLDGYDVVQSSDTKNME